MSLKITNECINCGACELECPNTAIYEGGKKWSYSDGTNLKGIKNIFGKKINTEKLIDPLEKEYFFIVKEKCTECIDFYNEPQCASVCPVNCCILDDNNIESKDFLLKKKKILHNNKK
ncbi:4Fe-4S binding protein [Candidatus Shikimatogenerans silvanidophilus]|uniref:4Fe-4S binding protein n=1 Tax=Candidatus Shikimatogenerans silvanidophilus TaxID=2782547 RepID=UPI001BAC412F|nr:4Fe-4S dicluster domain-containing protein [Candidatus Shikimatogenerans silvanidophilus]